MEEQEELDALDRELESKLQEGFQEGWEKENKEIVQDVLSQGENRKILDEVCLHFINLAKGTEEFARSLFKLTQHPDCPFMTKVRIYDMILTKRMQVEERTSANLSMGNLSIEDLEKEAGAILANMNQKKRRIGHWTTQELLQEKEKIQKELTRRETFRDLMKERRWKKKEKKEVNKNGPDVHP